MFPTINAVLLISKNPVALIEWYEEVFNIKFQKESHDHLKDHYYTKLGDTRLIIHHTDTYLNITPKTGAISIAFGVDSLSEFSDRVSDKGEVKQTDFGKIMEITDLDGNVLQVVQLK